MEAHNEKDRQIAELRHELEWHQSKLKECETERYYAKAGLAEMCGHFTRRDKRVQELESRLEKLQEEHSEEVDRHGATLAKLNVLAKENEILGNDLSEAHNDRNEALAKLDLAQKRIEQLETNIRLCSGSCGFGVELPVVEKPVSPEPK